MTTQVRKITMLVPDRWRTLLVLRHLVEVERSDVSSKAGQNVVLADVQVLRSPRLWRYGAGMAVSAPVRFNN